MILSLNKASLAQYVIRQLEHFFPDGQPIVTLKDYLDEALQRAEYCFSASGSKYFKKGLETYFNHRHSDQYAMFLYFLSNTVFKRGGESGLCEKLFCLNKALHGIDVFYEVELPSIFLFGHAVGTVLGRAHYSDFFLVQQNCTVGAARQAAPGQKNEYPILGKYFALYAGSSVLGKCTIGDNCKISAHSMMLESDLAANSIYIGTRTNHIIKPNKGPDHIWSVADEAK